MKTINYYMSFLAIFALLFTSCSKEETSDVSGPDVQDTFQLQFGALLNDFEKQQTKDHNTTPVVCRDADPSFVKIGLKDNLTGNFIGGDELGTPFLIDVNIQDNNGSWETSYSADLGLPAGSYSLEYFIVYSGVGDDAEVLWVAPRLGSAFGGDVGAPLPQPITLVAGTKPYINVDVLCYESRVEDAFGYLFFDIELTTVENSYCIFVNYCNTNGEDVDGREYPAKFMVEVWGDAYDGSEVIIAGEMNTINPGPAATVLCLALPKLLPNDTFFVRVTVMDDALLPYDVDENNPPVREFEISQANIDAQLLSVPAYEHIRINCGTPSGDPFCIPTGEGSSSVCEFGCNGRVDGFLSKKLVASADGFVYITPGNFGDTFKLYKTGTTNKIADVKFGWNSGDLIVKFRNINGTITAYSIDARLPANSIAQRCRDTYCNPTCVHNAGFDVRLENDVITQAALANGGFYIKIKAQQNGCAS